MQNIKKEFQAVISKAWEDDQFRKSLVDSPKAAIQSLTGLEIPQGYNLVVNDQTDVSKIFVNIPPKPNIDDMELTDEQLEQVAGGEIIISVLTGAIAGAIAGGVVIGGAVVGAAGAGAAAGINAGW